MRAATRLSLAGSLAAAVLTAAATAGPAGEDARGLRSPADFASIPDPAERSAALFAEAGKALLHPRCVNCHPAGDSPLQGEDGRLHEPPVTRGRGGSGIVGMQCSACHTDENFDPGRVPGAPHWMLAPRQMAWEGLTLAELCAQLRDPERNGGRTLDELTEHFAEDELVGWGWSPGAGREPAPGSQRALGELIRAWAETGAACPE